MRITDSRRGWSFDLGRHDVRSTLPVAIRAIMQNGLLWKAFEDALLPEFLYPAIADTRPWSGGLGDTTTFTRAGLLAPVTTPLNGADPTPQQYSIEQYSATMSQYGNAIDTSMIQSSMALASKFAEDVQKMGINAGQSVNQIARNKLYSAYAGGRSFATASTSASTSVHVADISGFGTVLVNGVPTAVSGGNPLNVSATAALTANTVVAVNPDVAGATSGPGTLTLGTAATFALNDPIVSSVAPVSFRPNARVTSAALQAGDIATMALFRSGVARLRTMNVDTVNGNYVAHIDPTTEAQLFADADFKQAYQGRGDSAVFGSMSLGTFAGIDWVRNNEAPTATVGSNTVHRPLLVGAGALISAPFDNMESLLDETGVQDVPNIKLIGPANGVKVAAIVRPPQDRLQQIVSSAWSFIGDFCVPSDSTTGGQGGADTALYKRAVLIEHL